FDSTRFTQGIEKVVRQAISLFGRAPYRDYTFLFQDDAYGALEHLNSVTLGAPSAALATDPNALLEETAHEYFHSWNLMRIRPAEYGGVDYRGQPPAAELWFSEGFTMFYADLLLRRAQLPVEDSSRARHLAHLVERYLSAEGYARYSAERVSRAANVDGPGNLGDYQLSTHLQGELIGAMLDLVIRDASHGHRTLDDLMRGMNERFSGATGFTGADVERVAAEVCHCGVKGFFDGWVRGKGPVRFDHYLRLIGLAPKVIWAPARSDSGAVIPDLRIWAWAAPGHASPSLILQTPNSVWGKAGLHTGDRVVGWNGAPIRDLDDFRAAIRRVQLNDTVRVTVRRDEKPVRVVVIATSYDTPSVTLEPISTATAEQRARRDEWLAGSAGDAGE
ncbi:MAG: PDZ domain-containing protein, partial [Gemmatimonadales bacterium]